MLFIAHPAFALRGRAPAPPDKSLSHRSLIFGALAQGRTQIQHLLEGDDVLRTAAAMRALGAEVRRVGDGAYVVESPGRLGLNSPASVLDFGNAGTGARLSMGAIVGARLTASFTGDASLSKRPMGRVIEPLTAIGAKALGRDKGLLPLTLSGRDQLQQITWRSRQASAQVKSAILLAALGTEGETVVIEPHRSRAHTETLLAAFGVETQSGVDETGGWRVSIRGGQALRPASVIVPGDPSSAAFATIAGLIVPQSDIVIAGVMLAPERDGLYRALRQMGADLSFENERREAGEQVADLRVRASSLRAITTAPEDAAAMIDEFPALAIACARAHGDSRLQGLGELRVKESDRLAAILEGLRAIGVAAEIQGDDLCISGMNGAAPAGAAHISTHGDHRIAMAFLVAGLSAKAPIAVDEAEMIATSFPGFRAHMAAFGAEITEAP